MKKLTFISLFLGFFFFGMSNSHAGVALVDNPAVALYGQIKSDKNLPSLAVFSKALAGYNKLKAAGKLKNENMLTIIDMSLASTQERMWIIDLGTKEVVTQTLVAHGRNSGNNYAKDFSNKPESYMSSLGFYVTGGTYQGKHGLSLQLNGQEPGFNSNARSRAVVMHGADYVSHDFVKQVGRLGRSLGCPAIPMEIHEEVISNLANGSCLFIWYPDAKYIKSSGFLKGAATVS